MWDYLFDPNSNTHKLLMVNSEDFLLKTTGYLTAETLQKTVSEPVRRPGTKAKHVGRDRDPKLTRSHFNPFTPTTHLVGPTPAR